MIYVNLYPVLFGMAAFTSTLSGGLVAARLSRSRLGVLTAFAAGVLIAVPLFDLLPEALRLASQAGVSLENVLQVTALGFISLYVLERCFSVHRVCEGDVCRNVRHPKGGLLGPSSFRPTALWMALPSASAFTSPPAWVSSWPWPLSPTISLTGSTP